MKLVDMLALEASASPRESSSLSSGTNPNILYFVTVFSGQLNQIIFMKTAIHPASKKVKYICSCGNVVEAMSTLKEDEIRVEICGKCHPFYTGEQRILKTGAVDKFYARMKKTESLKK